MCLFLFFVMLFIRNIKNELGLKGYTGLTRPGRPGPVCPVNPGSKLLILACRKLFDKKFATVTVHY